MYKTKRRYQGEPIRTDPTCDPKENETAIHFSGGDRYAWISSYEESVVAGLLAHPDFKIQELVLMRVERKDSVVGVVGKIPVAALRIGPSREKSLHEQVVPPILKDHLPPPPGSEPAKAPSRNGEPVRKAKPPRQKPQARPNSFSKSNAKPTKTTKQPARPRAKKSAPVNQLPLALGSNGKSNQQKKVLSKIEQALKTTDAASRKAPARKSKLPKPKVLAKAKTKGPKGRFVRRATRVAKVKASSRAGRTAGHRR